MGRAVALLAACAWLAACGGNDPEETASSPVLDSAIVAATPVDDSVTDTVNVPADTAGRRHARVRDAQGRELGTLVVEDRETRVRVWGRLSGLPQGEHAIHLHAVSRCEPPFESAGPHWNPGNRRHGTLNPQGPHAGDLPNITATGDGIADVDVVTPEASFDGLMDADGAAVVVHAGPDDYRTDPSGNSGDRIACGVVE